MIPLDTLQHSSFAPLLGQAFILHAGHEVEMVLHAATVLGHRRLEALRDPFSLTFHGRQGLRLPQGIYRFSHPSLGELEIFIAQAADGPKGSEFEAVFN
jgi:hypothetical protein